MGPPKGVALLVGMVLLELVCHCADGLLGSVSQASLSVIVSQLLPTF